MRVAFIPARGGCKQITCKNLKPFGSIPIIGWPTRATIDSKCLDPNIVSQACRIYPMPPFVRAKNKKFRNVFFSESFFKYAFLATINAYSIHRVIRITATNRVKVFQQENFEKRTGDLKSAFFDAAQFYWGHAAAWLWGQHLLSDAAVSVLLPCHFVNDLEIPKEWL
ncbi:cytidylyltransferase domain-containing protein [Limnohabitans sp. Bal53]|uniref:cytidylyltransferase domain-containing protein n=1 Tax=Limnohabitans sp. Bal53 TaxID=1977910 RepID=UPI000D392DD3|nr:hypothetical protein [Limnohabitans sp. Bal53]